ncbi:hypothetical protein ACLQ26_26325 [Micromonospora sp. DT43]|uniref:hypothetical protein n=1 Tax=Micromonospora sp. DT43 TaxID=3393440 RepID=UPI003CF149F2
MWLGVEVGGAVGLVGGPVDATWLLLDDGPDRTAEWTRAPQLACRVGAGEAA